MLVHGGPTWCWNAYFSDSEPNAVLLADAGYAVLLPNPRGSTGRATRSRRRVIGEPGGKDFDDIVAGIDGASPTASPIRTGSASPGLSYGGYMAGWAVAQTDRFKAAVAIRSSRTTGRSTSPPRSPRFDEINLTARGRTRRRIFRVAPRSSTRTGADADARDPPAHWTAARR